ncbi:hypothetical protein [Leptothoe spongobia]|uniref:Uncharacterized protein n=1 Tax=Leptothoe spongobia TAU-MAC 1115 TaxID=1967444 RepID=A0A947GJL4_9CYAN|nr:hypothetical protein [Leptothoe spongobia]MBT9316629.1 hypothetical protein [Leptothoe spongobia TAU-MAC 1115]
MTLSISSTSINQTSQLGMETRITLSIIDGGLAWLDWAMSDQQARYDFKDETELVSSVQQGLHTSSLCYLPNLGLLVSPIKLMTLGASLPILAKAESEKMSPDQDGELRQILVENNLRTQQDLADGLNLLKQLEVDQAYIFDALNFEGRLTLYSLYRSTIDSKADSDLQKEAAAFAIEQAFSCHEFCDYFQIYLLLSRQKSSLNKEERLERAKNCLSKLLPLLFGSLDSVQTSGIPAPAEISPLIQRWSLMGKRLGFQNISSALLEILKQVDYEEQPISYWEKTISAYLDTAKSFIAISTPVYAWINQAGNGCTVGYKTKDKQAELIVQDGLISLRSFKVISQTNDN